MNQNLTTGNTMKRLIALTLVTLGVAVSARAQWIVYDPTMNMQQIMAQAQNIAKYSKNIHSELLRQLESAMMKTVTTDSDGKFAVSVPGVGKFFLYSVVSRESASGTENYVWLVPL